MQETIKSWYLLALLKMKREAKKRRDLNRYDQIIRDYKEVSEVAKQV